MARRDRNAPIDWTISAAPRRRTRHHGLMVLIVIVVVLDVVGVWFLHSYRRLDVNVASKTSAVKKGDHLLVRKGHDVHRGDVVEFRVPIAPTIAVQRVVAVAGDHVGDRDGRLFIDGHPADESYLPSGTVTTKVPDLVVPPGTVYILGDHRSVSIDSREYGPVPLADIRGHLVFRYWPLGRLGGV